MAGKRDVFRTAARLVTYCRRPSDFGKKFCSSSYLVSHGTSPTRTISGSPTNISSAEYDIAIVGGGIVGLATARELILRFPKLKFCVLEKEPRVAAHQSSHNSGVIHCGIYYTPGSLKAKLCVEGLDLSYKYCNENQIQYKKCGKLIVATNQLEAERLDGLLERGKRNNVKDLEMLVGTDKIREKEPHCRGIKAIWCPNTGIVDWELVSKSFARNFQEKGGKVYLNFEVNKFIYANDGKPGKPETNKFPVAVASTNDVIRCRYVLTCGGLQSDKIAELSGCRADPRIIPFRGEYLLLNPDKRYLVRGNIYPVPDPKFPFLGVHFTPRINGEVWLGPNAVLAFKREGYKFSDINLGDVTDALRFKGFQKLMKDYFVFGVGEMSRSFNTSAQVKLLQRYVPELRRTDVERGPTGVRAQAMSLDGKLLDDFVFDGGRGELGKRTLHVRNAPSPACTSSLAIAKMIADEATKKFKLNELAKK